MIALANGEVIVRAMEGQPITGYGYKHVKHAMYNPFLLFGPNINKQVPHMKGEGTYWNSQGFRLDDNIPLDKLSNEYRIIALGGSTTESDETPYHYPQATTRILQKDHIGSKHIQVLNSGKSAYTTAHSLIRLQFDLLSFQPDMITVMNNINDLTVNFFPFSDERNNYANKYLKPYYAHHRSLLKDSFLRNSRLLVFLFQSLRTLKKQYSYQSIDAQHCGGKAKSMRCSDEPIELRAKDSFRNNLRAIAAIGKTHNIIVVFMSMPATYSDEKITLAFDHKGYNGYILYPPIEEFKNAFEQYNQVIKEVAQEQGVHFIDMYNLMGHEDHYFVDMVHYSFEGYKQFIKIYANALKKIIESKT